MITILGLALVSAVKRRCVMTEETEENLEKEFKRLSEELGKTIKQKLDDDVITTYQVRNLLDEMQAMINKVDGWTSSTGSCGWVNEEENGWQSSNVYC